MKWNADLYDNKHAFVAQYGESVLELLHVQPGERILDLGCGTGDLAVQIQDRGAEVTGIDASAEMIGKARIKYPSVSFSVADATRFHFDEPFDAVFTNATLHWIKNADAVIQHVYDTLKPGGRFAGEFGGKGNMQQMIAATAAVLQKHGYIKAGEDINPWYFPSVGEYAVKLENHGFRVTYMLHFDRPTALQDGREGVTRWLNMFGPSFFEGIPTNELPQILDEITDLLPPGYEKDGTWYADYKRLRFVAVKE